jgi:hypothetical protein
MLRIGKAINDILSKDAAVIAIVGTKLYPIAAPQENPLPFVVYRRNNINPDYVKDGWAADNGAIQINALSSDYAESVSLIHAVRKALELKRGVFAGVHIDSIYVAGANETVDANTYIQELVFQVVVKK